MVVYNPRRQGAKPYGGDRALTRLASFNVALNYYDYDAQNWTIEGWWTISRGTCTYLGDRFGRGAINYYAHSPGEAVVWRGTFGLCVSSQRFKVVNRGGVCASNRLRLFRQRQINESEYTLRLT